MVKNSPGLSGKRNISEDYSARPKSLFLFQLRIKFIISVLFLMNMESEKKYSAMISSKSTAQSTMAELLKLSLIVWEKIIRLHSAYEKHSNATTSFSKRRIIKHICGFSTHSSRL